MADSKTVTAAKKQTAAFDKPGLLALIRETYAMPEAVSDEMLIELVGKAFAGAPEPEMDLEKEPENPAAPVEIPALASAKPRIEMVDDGADRERVKALVASAVTAGKVTEATFEQAVADAIESPRLFEKWMETAPVLAPAAGQLVKASAADRKTQTEAERLTARYRNQRAASRPHFTQRGN